MDFEEMQQVWEKQSVDGTASFGEEELLEKIKSRGQHFAYLIGWFDWAMILCLGFMVIMCLRVPLLEGRDFFLFVPAVVCLAAAIFVWQGRMRRLKLRSKFDQSLVGMIDQSIAEIDSHVRRLRTIQWWCILPLTFTLLIGFCFADPSRRYLFYFVFGPLFVVCMSFTYWGVRCEIRNKLLPRRAELQSLRQTFS